MIRQMDDVQRKLEQSQEQEDEFLEHEEHGEHGDGGAFRERPIEGDGLPVFEITEVEGGPEIGKLTLRSSRETRRARSGGVEQDEQDGMSEPPLIGKAREFLDMAHEMISDDEWDEEEEEEEGEGEGEGDEEDEDEDEEVEEVAEDPDHPHAHHAASLKKVVFSDPKADASFASASRPGPGPASGVVVERQPAPVQPPEQPPPPPAQQEPAPKKVSLFKQRMAMMK